MDKLRIAVCDDEIVQQKVMQALLQKYFEENDTLAEVKFYLRPRIFKGKEKRDFKYRYFLTGYFYAGIKWNRYRERIKEYRGKR